ncbi:MAG: hypothetical protein AB1626_05580, partial [Candidatus Micrarchaeota archaeon]
MEEAPGGLDKKKLLIIAGVAAVAIVGAAYYFFVFATPAEEAAAFAVTVIGTEGEKVSGAVVEVFDGAELVASATTSDGRVELPDLPKKLLAIRITTPDGKRLTRVVDLARSKGVRIDFSEVTANETEAIQEGMQLEVKDSQTKQGIANAKVVYQFERNTETTTTNAAGRATIFVPTGIAVSLRASAPGYYTESLTLIASPPLPAIELRAKDPSAQIEFSDEERRQIAEAGRVVVLTEDADTGEGIASGTACVFSADTAEQLGCSEITEGSAEITGLQLGTPVYAVVNASGYYDYSNAMEAETAPTVTDLTIINARLRRIPLEAYASGALPYTIIRTVDENGAPVSATVHVIPYPSIVPLPAKQSTGELQLTLSNESTFYAIAYAEGRAPGMTGEFEAGDRQTIELPRATRENSASLEVIATDEDDQPLSGATITILLDGLLVLPPAQTAMRRVPTPTPQEGEEPEMAFSSQPSAFFPALALGLTYELRGKYQKGVGRGFVALSDDRQVRLPLLVNTGFLDVYANDLLTGKNVLGARFELRTDAGVLSSCEESPCTLAARAHSTASIYAIAPGYVATTRPLNSKDVVAGATKTITLSLLPSNAVNATMVQFTGLTDENGDAVYDIVRANYSYFANFVIASNAATRTGLHVRVGSAADVKSDKAGIIDFSPPANYEMAKSTSYRPSSTCEADLRNAEGELLKWVDLSFEGAGTANIAVPIQVKATAKTGDGLTLYYRGYSYLQVGSGAKAYSRVPADRTLGFNESTAGKAACYAETNSTAYEIIVPTPQETAPAPIIPLPKAEFTVTDTIVLEQDGTLRSAHGLEEYALQIDPVYPADAMPIGLKSKLGGCVVLVSQVAGNAST